MATLRGLTTDFMLGVIKDLEQILEIVIYIEKIKERNQDPVYIKKMQDKIKYCEKKLEGFENKLVCFQRILERLELFEQDAMMRETRFQYELTQSEYRETKMELDILNKLNELSGKPIKYLEIKTKLYEKCVAVLGSSESVDNLLELMSAKKDFKKWYIDMHCEIDKFRQKKLFKETRIKLLEGKIQRGLKSSDSSLNELTELKCELKDLESSREKKMKNLERRRKEVLKKYEESLKKAGDLFYFLETFLPSIKKTFTFTPRKVLC